MSNVEPPCTVIFEGVDKALLGTTQTVHIVSYSTTVMHSKDNVGGGYGWGNYASIISSIIGMCKNQELCWHF